jgi:energy-coupling factor transporter ATP-binding protein EcfA2
VGRIIETFTFGRNALKRTIEESASAVIGGFEVARGTQSLTSLKKNDNGRYNVVRDLISFTGALSRDGEIAKVTPIGEAFERLHGQNPTDAWRWLLTRSLWLYTVPNGTESAVNTAAAGGGGFDFFRRFLGLLVHLSALGGDERYLSYEEVCSLYVDDAVWRMEPSDTFVRVIATRITKAGIRMSTRSLLGDLEPEYGIPRDNFAALFGKTFSQTGLFEYRSAGARKSGIALASKLDAVLQGRVRFLLDNPQTFTGGDWEAHLAPRVSDLPEEVSLLATEEVVEAEPEQSIVGLIAALGMDLSAAGLIYTDDLLRRFAASLIAKRFVILTGLSGSGKTKLAQAFAVWISARQGQRRKTAAVGETVGTIGEKYRVVASNELAVELEDIDGGSRVNLPYPLVEEWLDAIEKHGFAHTTSANTIRDAVAPISAYSPQQNSFDVQLKAISFHLMTAVTQAPTFRRYEVVSVGPEWTSKEVSLGYADALTADRFVRTTPIIGLILRAVSDPDHPFFLILDEMNLAHVERYFSDFLSALESGEPIYLHGSAKPLDGVSPTLPWPPNLFLIGTVNVDDTTNAFSPKVLDRANSIEFRLNAASMGRFLVAPTSIGLEKIAARGEGFAKAFLAQARTEAQPKQSLPQVVAELDLLFTILERHGAEFGFRTASEALRFAAAYIVLGGPANDARQAIDAQVYQKILPKLNGSRRRLEPLLSALAIYCYDHRSWNGDSLANALEIQTRSRTAADLEDEKLLPLSQSSELAGEPWLSLSFDKVIRMLKRLNDEGFTSFAEA